MYGNKTRILKQLGDGLDMSFILPKRIPQFIFVTIDVLCPIFAVLTTVNPTLIILGLNDEEPIYRNNHMIDLSTVSSILNHEVIDNLVLVLGKK